MTVLNAIWQLFAKGGDEGPEHHKAHRLVNAWEFAKLARQSAEMGRYVIAAGDFNSIPATLPMTIIREHAGLTDAWVSTHRNTRTLVPNEPVSAVDAIHTYGVTADSPLNSFSAAKALEAVARRQQGKRLDYIFYRLPSSPPASDKTPILTCVDTKVVFTEDVPGTSFSYSDHFGMEATFEISLPKGGDVTDPEETYVPAPVRPRSPSFVLTSTPNPTVTPPKYLSADSVTAMLQSLTARYRYAVSQGRYQLSIFAGSLSLLFVMTIFAAWWPWWLASLITLLTIFLSWLATTMLYIGFVYAKWEANALTNVIEELELYKASLDQRNARSHAGR